MTISHRQRGDGSVDIIDTGFHRLENSHRGQAGSGVALHMDRDGQAGLQARDQFERRIGGEDAGHVLDRHGVGAHIFDLLRQIDPHLQGVHRAGGVGNGALGVLAVLFHRTQCRFQITRIVHRIEHAEHVDAVDRSALDKLLHHIVGIVAIAQQVLPTQQHLLARVGHGLLQLTDALPRILAEVADTGIERRSTPALNRPEPDLIELGGYRQHVL